MMIEYIAMDRRAILSMASEINEIIRKYHGPGGAIDIKLHIDYAAILMLAWIDEGTKKDTKEVRSEYFAHIMQNVLEMAEACDGGGFAGMLQIYT